MINKSEDSFGVFKEFIALLEDAERLREENITSQLKEISDEINDLSLSQVRT
jgi:hypothetical protein